MILHSDGAGALGKIGRTQHNHGGKLKKKTLKKKDLEGSGKMN